MFQQLCKGELILYHLSYRFMRDEGPTSFRKMNYLTLQKK